MKVFVINLEKDVARRESIERQLNALGLPFELVRGVHGASLSPAELREVYSDRGSRWNRCRSLVPAEIGCALSHVSVYRSIAATGCGSALILEDDAIRPASLPDALGAIEAALDPDRSTVVLLSPAQADGVTGVKVTEEGHVLAPYRSGFYTSSYVMTRRAAELLAEELFPVNDVADCWRRVQRYGLAEMRVIVPALVVQDQTTFGSSTNDDHHGSKGPSPLAWLAYKACRLRAVTWERPYSLYRRLRARAPREHR